MEKGNRLILGDNLEMLKTLPNESIDLCYIDPPFFSNRNYEVIWGDTGEFASFKDRWAGGMEHYIGWLDERAREIWRTLKKTGSFYIHCDWHADAYIRAYVLDKLVGRISVNNISWHYTGNSVPKKCFPRKHNSIFWYSKSKDICFNPRDVLIPYSPLTEKRYNHTDANGRRYKISALRN